MSDTRVEQIKKRCDAASTPPWIVHTGKPDGQNWEIGLSSIDDRHYQVTTDGVHASEFDGDAKTDAEFMAHARTDIPYLLARLALAEEVCEALDVMMLVPGSLPRIAACAEVERLFNRWRQARDADEAKPGD